jgi:3'-phosphoadenosine 5'-phosphosulfate sulfotransferase
MSNEPDKVSIPVDEVRKLAKVALSDNMDIMVALGDFDKREEGVMKAQPTGHYFTLKLVTGIFGKYDSTNTVSVMRTTPTHPMKTDFVRAE